MSAPLHAIFSCLSLSFLGLLSYFSFSSGFFPLMLPKHVLMLLSQLDSVNPAAVLTYIHLWSFCDRCDVWGGDRQQSQQLSRWQGRCSGMFARERCEPRPIATHQGALPRSQNKEKERGKGNSHKGRLMLLNTSRPVIVSIVLLVHRREQPMTNHDSCALTVHWRAMNDIDLRPAPGTSHFHRDCEKERLGSSGAFCSKSQEGTRCWHNVPFFAMPSLVADLLCPDVL